MSSATPRFVYFSFTAIGLKITSTMSVMVTMPTMSTMSAMSEEMHRDKQDAD